MTTTFEYVNALGTTVPFHAPDEGRYWTDEALGIDMPPVAFASTAPYGKAGSILRSVRFTDREVHIPVAIIAGSLAELRERTRAFTGTLNPRFGDGVLYATTVLGEVSVPEAMTTRALRCRYAKGLEGAIERLNDTTVWQAFVVTMHAFDPLWYDPEPTAQTFPFGPDAANPFFPMFADSADVGPHFGSSNTFLDIVVENTGDETAWPVWTIHGPITNPIITNDTTGETLEFTTTLSSSHYMVVNTEQGYVTALDQDGHNVLSTLTYSSQPFGFLPGPNVLSLSGAGTGAATAVSFEYTTRYLNA